MKKKISEVNISKKKKEDYKQLEKYVKYTKDRRKKPQDYKQLEKHWKEVLSWQKIEKKWQTTRFKKNVDSKYKKGF